MAGHSQFKNIMFRKGAQDAKRSKLFSKLSKEITVAVKMGGEDPGSNSRLRLAIQEARAQNMPKDNIERAVKKAFGGDESNYDEMRYEGYGPGGVAIIVEALTDNRNRTASDVRTAFSKNGGALGETNSVSFMFDRVGQVLYAADKASADEMLEAAIEAGADDCISGPDGHEVVCGIGELNDVATALSDRFGDAESTKLVWKPQTLAPVDDDDKAATLMKLMDILDDNDDVQNVYANYDIPDEVMERLS